MVAMAMITLVVGSVGLFVAGFVAWYTIWQRRAASSFERVPVRTRRSADVVSDGESGDGLA